MTRPDFETTDEAGAAALERANTEPAERPDLSDVMDQHIFRGTE